MTTTMKLVRWGVGGDPTTRGVGAGGPGAVPCHSPTLPSGGRFPLAPKGARSPMCPLCRLCRGGTWGQGVGVSPNVCRGTGHLPDPATPLPMPRNDAVGLVSWFSCNYLVIFGGSGQKKKDPERRFCTQCELFVRSPRTRFHASLYSEYKPVSCAVGRWRCLRRR